MTGNTDTSQNIPLNLKFIDCIYFIEHKNKPLSQAQVVVDDVDICIEYSLNEMASLKQINSNGKHLWHWYSPFSSIAFVRQDKKLFSFGGWMTDEYLFSLSGHVSYITYNAKMHLRIHLERFYRKSCPELVMFVFINASIYQCLFTLQCLASPSASS